MVKREGMEDLLLRYYEGETTEDETALVEEWLEASEENRRTARQVQTLGLAADMAQISSRLDVKKALKDVHRKMKQKKVNRYQVLFRGMQRAAAILFIPLMVSWSILYWDKDKEEIHMMEVRTNPGMTTSVELPDGTEVVLNSSSSLRYPSRFADDKREVKLVALRITGHSGIKHHFTGYRFLITERLARETAPVVEDQCYISHLIYLEWLFFRIDKLFLYSL